MHIASQVAQGIGEGIYNKGLQEIRIATLLHDIGHPPFSHSLENVILRNPKFIPKN